MHCQLTMWLWLCVMLLGQGMPTHSGGVKRSPGKPLPVTGVHLVHGSRTSIHIMRKGLKALQQEAIACHGLACQCQDRLQGLRAP